MEGWSEHTGRAISMPLQNVDTDQLIPARFMSVLRSEGYGAYLLHDLRRDAKGRLKPEFPLNRFSGASILVSGRNFGSGSSREAAVYALVDDGIRAVIAPSFGNIFSGNAVNNGLLPACVTEKDAALLAETLGEDQLLAHIDLPKGKIVLGELEIGFELDNSWREKLLNGWDDIDLTFQLNEKISGFKRRRQQSASWAWAAKKD